MRDRTDTRAHDRERDTIRRSPKNRPFIHLSMADPETHVVLIDVPAELVGRVIGKGGATILSIREATGANISNKRAEGPGPVQFRVWGPTSEGVEAAKNRIMEIICKRM